MSILAVKPRLAALAIATVTTLGLAAPPAAAAPILPDLDFAAGPVQVTYARAGLNGSSYTSQPLASTRMPTVETYWESVSPNIQMNLSATCETDVTIGETILAESEITAVKNACGWTAGLNKRFVISAAISNTGAGAYAAKNTAVVRASSSAGVVAHEVGHTLGLDHSGDANHLYGNRMSVMGSGNHVITTSKFGTPDASMLSQLGLLPGWPAAASGNVSLTALAHPTARSTMRWDYNGRRYYAEYRRDILGDTDVIDASNEHAGLAIVSEPWPRVTGNYVTGQASVLHDLTPTFPQHTGSQTDTWYVVPGMQIVVRSFGTTMNIDYVKSP